MAGPGGKEVGRVSIRVVADTSRIKPDVVRALKGVEGLRPTVQVRAKLDESSVRTSVARIGAMRPIAAMKGPLPKDRRELIPQGRALMSGVKTGLRVELKDTLRFVSTIGPTIVDAVQAVDFSDIGRSQGDDFARSIHVGVMGVLPAVTRQLDGLGDLDVAVRVAANVDVPARAGADGANGGVEALLGARLEEQQTFREVPTERGLPLDTRRGELIARLAERGSHKTSRR